MHHVYLCICKRVFVLHDDVIGISISRYEKVSFLVKTSMEEDNTQMTIWSNEPKLMRKTICMHSCDRQKGNKNKYFRLLENMCTYVSSKITLSTVHNQQSTKIMTAIYYWIFYNYAVITITTLFYIHYVVLGTWQ